MELINAVKQGDWAKAEKLIGKKAKIIDVGKENYMHTAWCQVKIRVWQGKYYTGIPFLVWAMRYKPPLSFVKKAVLAINGALDSGTYLRLDCYEYNKPKSSRCYAFYVSNSYPPRYRATVLSPAVKNGQEDVVKWLLSDENIRKEEILKAEKRLGCPVLRSLFNLKPKDEDLALLILKRFWQRKEYCPYIFREKDLKNELLLKAKVNNWVRVTELLIGKSISHKVRISSEEDKKRAILKLLLEKNPEEFAEDLTGGCPCYDVSYLVLDKGLKKVEKQEPLERESFIKAELLYEYEIKNNKILFKNYSDLFTLLNHIRCAIKYCKNGQKYINILLKIARNDLQKAKINSYEATKLLADAAVLGDFKIINILLNKGAKLNIPISDYNTVLSYAIKKEANLKVISYLLRRGANPNVVIPATGQTALFVAVKKGQINVVRLLLKNHANPNWKDRDGMTPFLYGLWYYNKAKALKQKDKVKRWKIVRLLRLYGGRNPYPKGLSPIDAGMAFLRTSTQVSAGTKITCYGFPNPNMYSFLNRQRNIQCGIFNFSYLNEDNLETNPDNFSIRGIFSQLLAKEIKIMGRMRKKRFKIKINYEIDLSTPFVSWLIRVVKICDPDFFKKAFHSTGYNKLPARVHEIMITGHILSQMVLQNHLDTFNNLVESFVYSTLIR